LGSARTFDDLRLGRALWNGDNPPGVYSNLWGNIGANTTDYNKSMQSQWRFTGSVNFDIGGHSIIAGFEVEQRIDRGFAVSANNLWTLMFQLQNDHVLELDLANPIPVFRDGVFPDTINYNRKFDGDKLSAFSERFRRSQGLDPQGVDFLNVFGYEPDDFELGFFSADELINLSGSRLVNYFGYDHTGQLSDRRVSINDFFEARGADGRRLRPIGAFEPIYAAFFIQDQFTFDDLRFNVGVRVDRYDANQPVLRDPYNLYPGANAGELRGGFGGGRILGDIPTNIGDAASIYVDNYNYFLDGTETSRIVGFRHGDDFFDALGRRLDDPNELQRLGGGVVRPVLFDSPDNVSLNAESFRDYTPQIVVMPRISFDFPISDEALFYAHYDVLAQRPDVGLSRFNPINMLELEFGKNLNQPIGNPDLLPQRTTDYELGFQQILTEKSSLKIAGFYREMRDMMQTIALTAAYPNTYITYGNRDFGTVKGFSFEYDLRRTNNISINANYTLQFADGTGSGPNTSLNLARTNQPNLRYILPLSFDSRHQLLLRVDYRYGKGINYNGPVWWNKRVFENAGINFVVTGNSGTPYSRRQFAYAITQAETSVPLTGQINGSRLPWQVRVDSRINKRFDFAFKKGGTPKNGLDIYIQVLNLFNTLNVSNVYAYTGAPDDDGFLTSPQSINFVNSAVSSQSYIDLYQAAMLNPFNFGLPRRIRLGIVLDF
jgi:outer membrane receptor protein involved in Fe transport